MNCGEFEKMIPAFVADELDYKQLKAFLEHVNGCEECREELTIQVLVSEGMARLEEGGTFDLQKEIDRRTEAAEHGVRIHRMLKYLLVAMGILAVSAVGLVIGLWVL